MERSRLTRSTAPESVNRGATSRLGPLFSPSGSRVSRANRWERFLPQTHENDVTVMRCNHVEKADSPGTCRSCGTAEGKPPASGLPHRRDSNILRHRASPATMELV